MSRFSGREDLGTIETIRMIVNPQSAYSRSRQIPALFLAPLVCVFLLISTFCHIAFSAQEGGTLRQRQSSPSASSQRVVPATMFTVEGEDLVKAGKIQTNAGKVVVQPMAGFGPGWSGGAQLFWSGGAVGATLDLTIDVPASATYAVELYMTRAPDYADFIMEINGKPSALKFSAYTQSVMAPNPMQVGNFPLQAGLRKLSLLIVGKYPQGTLRAGPARGRSAPP